MRLALAAILLLTSAPETPAPKEVRCDVRANLMDSDPAGTNVRSGAGRDFAAIGRLPTDRTDLVSIVASEGAWVKISRAVDEEDEAVFAKPGWVYAPLLGMTVSWNPDDPGKSGSHSLHAGPNGKSRVLGRLPATAAVTLEGCEGRWVKIRHEGRSGWLSP